MTNWKKHFDPALASILEEAEKSDLIFVNTLEKGDVLEVQTRNTLYRFEIDNPKTGGALVTSTGKYFNKPTNVHIAGTTLSGSGSMLKLKAIVLGFSLVLIRETRPELILSRTQSVKVNGVRVLGLEVI